MVFLVHRLRFRGSGVSGGEWPILSAVEPLAFGFWVYFTIGTWNGIDASWIQSF